MVEIETHRLPADRKDRYARQKRELRQSTRYGASAVGASAAVI